MANVGGVRKCPPIKMHSIPHVLGWFWTLFQHFRLPISKFLTGVWCPSGSRSRTLHCDTICTHFFTVISMCPSTKQCKSCYTWNSVLILHWNWTQSNSPKITIQKQVWNRQPFALPLVAHRWKLLDHGTVLACSLLITHSSFLLFLIISSWRTTAIEMGTEIALEHGDINDWMFDPFWWPTMSCCLLSILQSKLWQPWPAMPCLYSLWMHLWWQCCVCPLFVWIVFLNFLWNDRPAVSCHAEYMSYWISQHVPFSWQTELTFHCDSFGVINPLSTTASNQ